MSPVWRWRRSKQRFRRRLLDYDTWLGWAYMHQKQTPWTERAAGIEVPHA